MRYIAPTESLMWDDGKPMFEKNDHAISDRYARGDGRIIIETNREKLPFFVRGMAKPDYMDLRPFYQRRPRWKPEKQSLLIESFIMNIPVPPVFLYERDYNRYEVMDGQQRLTALRDFYDNRFELTGLNVWTELNGRMYRTLPESIRSALDRRSIGSIVVLKESTSSEKDANFLREIVFERLNTGATDLSAQEVRNALYQSSFNDLLLDLSRMDQFRTVWGLPLYEPEETENNPGLRRFRLYSHMEDVELVLRFFALRFVDEYRGGMINFLNSYMQGAMKFDRYDLEILESIFTNTLDLAYGIFGELTFRSYDNEKLMWSKKPQKAFYDAVMGALFRNLDSYDKLLRKKDLVLQRTIDLFLNHEKGTFTGRGNSKNDIRRRIHLFDMMLKDVAGE